MSVYKGLLLLLFFVNVNAFALKGDYEKKLVRFESTNPYNAAAVEPFGRSLFYLYNNLGVFSPENRADAISDRIEAIANESSFNADSLEIKVCDYGYVIVYKKSMVVMAITKADAKSEGLNNLQLAQKNLSIIKSAVLAQRDTNYLLHWMKRLGVFMLVLIGMLVIVVALKSRYKKI